jgi:hypothetical protein
MNEKGIIYIWGVISDLCSTMLTLMRQDADAKLMQLTDAGLSSIQAFIYNFSIPAATSC